MKLPDREGCCAERHSEMWKLATYTPPVVLVRRFEHDLCKCAVSGVSPRTQTEGIDTAVASTLNLKSDWYKERDFIRIFYYYLGDPLSIESSTCSDETVLEVPR
jgi:hypothetical protein